MQVRQLQIGDFRREALSTWFGRKFITPRVHLICLQHVRRDAACRAGLSACQRRRSLTTFCRSINGIIITTFRVSRRRREMYRGHARLSGCLSVCVCVCPQPHAHTIARTRM